MTGKRSRGRELDSLHHLPYNEYMQTKQSEPEPPLERVLTLLRDATRNSEYENKIYLVGGLLRDRMLGLPIASDLDLVLEGDAVALAHFLYEKRLSTHYPVTYPRFGTAMLHIGGAGATGCDVELVSARAESYHADSRKPEVRQGTLEEDVFRRDFTLNTLLENLHTGEISDLTGRGLDDLRDGILRTPLEPRLTFFDDPLRMLRAVRFAARFGFIIEAATWEAMTAESERLRPPAISAERIRDEFVKIIKLPGTKARRGMALLLDSGLLEKFLPEMLPMIGCTQGSWHPYDVWTHTLTALEALPDTARLELRLGLLWHDVGKPSTRSVREDGQGVRFYGHAAAGAEIARAMMNRLKFANEEIRDVTTLVNKHMRLGEYRETWTDASVKRLIRECGSYLDDLFMLARCDMSALNIPTGEGVDLNALRVRIDRLNALYNVTQIDSPLDGNEIMTLLNTEPGPHLKQAKDFLTNEVIEGRLEPQDKAAAQKVLLHWWRERGAKC